MRGKKNFFGENPTNKKKTAMKHAAAEKRAELRAARVVHHTLELALAITRRDAPISETAHDVWELMHKDFARKSPQIDLFLDLSTIQHTGCVPAPRKSVYYADMLRSIHGGSRTSTESLRSFRPPRRVRVKPSPRRGKWLVLFCLVQMFAGTSFSYIDDEDVTRSKQYAQTLVCDLVDRLSHWLCHPSAAAAAAAAVDSNGNNVLHILASAFPWQTNTNPSTYWLLRAIRELTLCGRIDINARNSSGDTVMLVFATNLPHYSAIFTQLLQLGANINTQNNDGRTLWHLLINRQEIDVLRELYEKGTSIEHLEYFHKELSTGRTIQEASCATFRTTSTATTRAIAVRQLIATQIDLLRTARMVALSEVLLPDLANIALQYLDGSGRPFAQ